MRAKKHLSQNFLIDDTLVARLVADVSGTVVEIGPGHGAITRALLARGCRVIAIEKDAALAAKLPRLGGDLRVIGSDLFDVDLTEFGPAELVSNIPFHLTGPILGLLAPMHDTFTTLTLIVQKEVAERIVSPPGCKAYGRLSVLAQHYADVQWLFPVPAEAFSPKPKIDAAAVRLRLRKPKEKIDFALVQKAFGQRRKMLTSALKEWLPREAIIDVLQRIGLSEKARPEELSVAAFVQLSQAYWDQQKQ